MKAKIDQHGMLYIIAETELESYALNRWTDLNFSGVKEVGIDTNNITIETGVES